MECDVGSRNAVDDLSQYIMKRDIDIGTNVYILAVLAGGTTILLLASNASVTQSVVAAKHSACVFVHQCRVVSCFMFGMFNHGFLSRVGPLPPATGSP